MNKQKQPRADRLKTVLRENLKRRKAQTRSLARNDCEHKNDLDHKGEPGNNSSQGQNMAVRRKKPGL